MSYETTGLKFKTSNFFVSSMCFVFLTRVDVDFFPFSNREHKIMTIHDQTLFFSLLLHSRAQAYLKAY